MEDVSEVAQVPEVLEAEGKIRPDSEFAEIGLGQYFRLTPNGLLVREIRGRGPTFDDCHAMWLSLRTIEKGVQFAIGDAARYIRERFGEKADQILTAATGLTASSLRAYEWASEKVPQEVRRLDVLDYSHHQAVAALPPREQKKWLDEAAKGDAETGEPWSVKRLKAAVKAGADVPVETWVLVVECESESKRDQLKIELEAKGYACHASEKRKAAKQ